MTVLSSPLLYTALAAFVVGWVACAFFVRWRKWHIRVLRQGITLEEFRKQFEGSGCADTAVKMAYDDLLSHAGHAGFRYDRLDKTLGFTERTFEALALERYDALGTPQAMRSRYVKLLSHSTVDHYVGFLSMLMGSRNSVRDRHSRSEV